MAKYGKYCIGGPARTEMEQKGKFKTLLMSKLWKLYNQRPCEDRNKKIGGETETGGTLF